MILEYWKKQICSQMQQSKQFSFEVHVKWPPQQQDRRMLALFPARLI